MDLTDKAHDDAPSQESCKMKKRSPNFWSVGDDAKVVGKTINHGFGGLTAIHPQVGTVSSVSPLRVRVTDHRGEETEIDYDWDQLSEP
jgi:hypothetical protein